MGRKCRILGCIDSVEMAPASSQEISCLAAPNLRNGCLRQRAFRQTENVADLNVQCRSAKTRRTLFRMRSWRASCRKTTVRRGNDKNVHFADWHLHWQKTRQLTETVQGLPSAFRWIPQSWHQPALFAGRDFGDAAVEMSCQRRRCRLLILVFRSNQMECAIWKQRLVPEHRELPLPQQVA